MRKYFILGCILFLGIESFTQTTVEVTLINYATLRNRDCVPFGGNSDFEWDFQIIDNLNIKSVTGHQNGPTGNNGPYSYNLNSLRYTNVFCSALPTYMYINWEGFQTGGISTNGETGIQNDSILIPTLGSSTTVYFTAIGTGSCSQEYQIGFKVEVLNSPPLTSYISSDFSSCVGYQNSINSGITGINNDSISFNWSPGNVLSDSTIYNPIANLDTTSTLTVDMVYCGTTYSEDITITIDTLEKITGLSCSNVTDSSITFTWDDIVVSTYNPPWNPSGYYISSDSGMTYNYNGSNSVTYTGLSSNQSINFFIYAREGTWNCTISDTAYATCTTPPCTISEQSATAATNTFCEDGGSTTIDLGSTETGVYYYLRNNANDTIIDGPISGTGAGISLSTGNISNTTTYNVYSSKPSSGLNLDGTDDFVIIPDNNSLDLTNTFTLEAWIFRHTLNSQDGIIEKYNSPALNGYGLRISNSNKLQAFTANGATWQVLTGTFNIPINQWVHISATYSSSNNAMKLYVNGVLDVENYAFTLIPTPGTQSLKIGGRGDDGNEVFDGTIDDVRIWNTYRSGNEIKNNMRECLSGSETGLVAYYNFEDVFESPNLIDKTGNGNDGVFAYMIANTSLVSGIDNCSDCNLELSTTTTVSILPELTGTHIETVCYGESITVNGNVYDAATPTGTEVFNNIGANNCDSTVTVNLTVLPELTGTHNETVCFGGSITVNGNTYDAATPSGTEVFNNIGANNCDSTVTVNLTVLPELTGTHNETVCFGGSITVNGNVYDATTPTGTEVFNNIGANNCDSTVTVNLTVLPELTGTHIETVCYGESITVNGNVYDSATPTGTEVFNNIGANNCDSTVAVNLTVLPELTGTHNETVCFGGSITVNGNVYDATTPTGTEVFNNIGANNCDSTVTVNLTVLPELTGTHNETVCFGSSITVNGNLYDATTPTGTEVFNNIGANICDSTVAVNLTVLPELTGTHNETVCFGSSITVNGNLYDATTPTGTEVFNNIGTNNCDSTVTVNLTLLPELTGSITQSICYGDSIVVNGTTYNSTVTGATETFNNIGVNNCDSIVTINLTVEPAIDLTITNSSPILTANQNGANYQWLDCDNGNVFIPTETNQSFTAIANGNYAVEITVGSCVDTSACENISTVSIIEEASNVISIYPNPTNGMVNINFGDNNSLKNYTIYSLEGKIIETGNTDLDAITIDLSKESNGVYLVKINTEQTSTVYKLIKQ